MKKILALIAITSISFIPVNKDLSVSLPLEKWQRITLALQYSKGITALESAELQNDIAVQVNKQLADTTKK